MKKFINKKQNKKIAQFLTDNEEFNNKFMSMTKEEQMVAIRILKAII